MEKINWADYKGAANPVTEAYREIRTNLQNTNAKLIAFTSLTATTEQSKIVAGLAISLAQNGKHVLLADGNFAFPSHHILFDLPNEGLTDAVAAGKDLNGVIQHCLEQENLDIMVGGTSSLVGNQVFSDSVIQFFLSDVQARYDYIFMDMPPIDSGSDAIVVSPKVDGMVLVITRGVDRINALIDANEKLTKVGAHVLGCILDKV